MQFSFTRCLGNFLLLLLLPLTFAVVTHHGMIVTELMECSPCEEAGHEAEEPGESHECDLCELSDAIAHAAPASGSPVRISLADLSRDDDEALAELIRRLRLAESAGKLPHPAAPPAPPISRRVALSLPIRGPSATV